MRQTLFFIPDQIGNLPVFGVGLLLTLWLIGGALVLIYLIRKQGLNADTKSYLPVFVIVGLGIIFILPNVVEAGKGLPVRSYGVMTMLAIISAIRLATYRGKNFGISKETIYAFAFGFCVAGFIGARIFHVIEYWQVAYRRENQDGTLAFYPTLTAILNVPQGGLVVYGALIGGMIAFIYLVRRFHLPPLAFADFIAPSMLLGLAIGRLGCFLNGCCFGGLCDVPWAVTFPESSPPYNQQIERGLPWGIQLGVLGRSESASSDHLNKTHSHGLKVLWRNAEVAERGLDTGQEINRINNVKNPSSEQLWAILNLNKNRLDPILIETKSKKLYSLPLGETPKRSQPIHPTQIYSAISAFLFCLVLLAYAPFRTRDGQVFGLMITIYPIIRILLEMIRIDEIGQFGTGLSISQIISILLLAGVSIYWVFVLRQPRGTLRFEGNHSTVPRDH
ncbi:MAG: prolipoprotein diacylglyceryl transferase [Planctomycetota bacterium]|nr:prolipoprotein diacylglyceryl transferase [Planctomycetota bacterium]